jgi:hypothetical protein
VRYTAGIWDVEVKRTRFVILLAGLVGFALGAAMLAYLAMVIGISLLGLTRAGIHSDWALAVLFAVPVCFVLGGIVGAKGAVRLATRALHRFRT